jgi:hypothetical protein
MTRVNRVYRYPPALRALGLFGSMLAGGVLLGSVLAEIEAADAPDLILHGIGAIIGAAILWLGLEFGARRIALTEAGISTRLLRERSFPWSEVRETRAGPFGVQLIFPRRGGPIVIWPYLEDFGELLEALAKHIRPREPMTS